MNPLLPIFETQTEGGGGYTKTEKKNLKENAIFVISSINPALLISYFYLELLRSVASFSFLSCIPGSTQKVLRPDKKQVDTGYTIPGTGLQSRAA